MSDILLILPSLAGQLTPKELVHRLWNKCGGKPDEVVVLLDLLKHLRLIRSEGVTLKRTQAGDKLAKSIRLRDQAALGLYLIRAGHFYDQARLLLELGTVDASGVLRCPIRAARTVAPQLVALLESWRDVSCYPELSIPALAMQELNSVWALLPPPVATPKWLAERKEVGDRAEMYTVQFERTQINPSHIIWVARDTDALGYDVEDRSVSPSRCIEVKGRRDHDVLFFLSENEWAKAEQLQDLYEIHFWGGIDLASEPALEYAALRQAGYPHIYKNPLSHLGTKLASSAVKWKFTAI